MPVPEGSAARKLSYLALDLIGCSGIDQDEMERRCSAALARAAEIQQSVEPGTVGDLPAQLARLFSYRARPGRRSSPRMVQHH